MRWTCGCTATRGSLQDGIAGRVGWRDCWRERDGDRRQGRGKVSGHERRWHFHDQLAPGKYTVRAINAFINV